MVVERKHIYSPEEILREMELRTDFGLKHIEIIKNYLVRQKILAMPSEQDAINWFKENFFQIRMLRQRPLPIKIVVLQNVLVHRPDFEDATHWSAYWFQKNQIFSAEQHGLKPIDLYKENDVYAKTKQAIQQYDPIYVCGVGHGDEETFTGQNYNIIYTTTHPESLELLRGRMVHLLSCEVGKHLGKVMVEEHGAVFFVGYSDVYIFVISEFPNHYAEPFFNCDACFDKNMFNGLTSGESFKAMQKAYQDAIDSPNVPNQCKPYLQHDLDCLVFYGDENARIKPSEKKTELWIVLIDYAGKKYPVYDKFVPVNADIVDTITIPKEIPEGDGEFYIVSKISNTDVAHVEVPVKFVKKPPKHRIIVNKPQPNEEIAIGSTYTFILRVEYSGG